jgi:hypothetical protein
MRDSIAAISASVTCFVRPSLHTSCTLPRSRTSTRVTTGRAISAPIALDNILLSGDACACDALSNPRATRSSATV